MIRIVRLVNFNNNMNQELTILEQLRTWLMFYGIPPDFEIEAEAEEMLLAAISSEDVTSVSIEDGSLVIEYKDEEPHE